MRPAAGVSNAELVARINAASPDADALTRDDAARLTPGVAQVRQSFSLIFVLFGVVVPLVTGLFFLISTLQKAGALTLLRAIGVPAARLVGSLFVQVAVVLGLGLGIGLALYTPVSSLTIGDIPLSFQTDAVLAWSALLAVCGLASALVSAAASAGDRSDRRDERLDGRLMRLSLLELRRQPSRFVAAGAILSLLATLLMLLGGLLDGLISGATGALAAQRADVVVYSSTSEASLVRSRIDAEQRTIVVGVEGVESVGGLGIFLSGARVPGGDQRDLADVVVIGYEVAPAGVPRTVPEAGRAYADRSLEAAGVEEGMTIEIGPARTPVQVAGWVDDLRYAGQGTLWVSLSTWRGALSDNRPDAVMGPDVVQAIVVRSEPGADASTIAGRIDAATSGSTQSLTLVDAVEAIPGVTQQRNTFGQIIGVTALIVVAVVALFFALLTLERTPLFGVLKALGATSGRVFAGVLIQAVVVTMFAAAVGTAIAAGLGIAVPPGSIPYVLTPGRVMTSVLLLVVASVVGCGFSLRQVLRIDPASAIGRTM